jgi:cell division protein FtsN
MSRIGDLIKRDANEPVLDIGQPTTRPAAGNAPAERVAVGSADPRGPLPWLEPAPDDFDDDTIRDEPLIPRKWLGIGSALFLVLLAGVVYAIYKKSSSNAPANAPVLASGAASADDPRIPLIEKSKQAVREKPNAPGGMQVADTDKQVYDVADGQIIETPTQLATAAEEPVERPTAPPPSPAVSKIPDVPPVIVPPTDIRPAAKPPVADVKPVIKPTLIEPKPAKPVVVAKPVVAKPVAKPEPAGPEPVKVVPAIVSAGSVYLQLGAFSTRDRAEAAWAQVSGKAALAGLSSNIQAAGPGKFRLRAGPLASRDAGEAVCAKLKAGGQACLIAK